MKNLFLIAILAAMTGGTVATAQKAEAVNISGTWQFSVDLDNGGHGDPTFVFKHEKEGLTGSYDGPLGQYALTGTVKDKKAEFGFEFTNEGETHKATYAATIESSTKMSGTVSFSGGGPSGKWTATKK